MGESYYELLGVTRDASDEDIERAYREKLKETHPDVSDDENASERTKRLIEAKETLTDEAERARYDRIGHDAYVGDDDSSAGPSEGGTDGAATSAASGRARTAGPRGGSTSGTTATGSSSTYGTTSHGAATGSGREATAGAGGATTAGTGGTGAGTNAEQSRSGSWYDGTADDGSRSGDGSWRAWDTDGSYAVNREGDSYQHGRMFQNQRSLILLLATFAVYPVLLFGALVPQFPLAVNLTVGMCVILVIAFLQSVPEVGIAVFGVWSVLLPISMFWIGIDFVTIRAFVAMVAVVFPFGLSVLTRVAIRPMSAG